MKIIECPKCDKKINKASPRCPHCKIKYPNKKRKNGYHLHQLLKEPKPTPNKYIPYTHTNIAKPYQGGLISPK
jgi:predicted amidophosphoribosyltransferase